MVVISNIIGWAIYESMVASVQGNSLLEEKQDMKLLNLDIPMPRPIVSLSMAMLSSLVIQYSF